MYIRSISTYGGQTSYGMVKAYNVKYTAEQGSTDYKEIYAHKTTTIISKTTSLMFAGNAVPTMKNPQEICPRVKAYRARVYPLAYDVKPFLRIEMKGCLANKEGK